MALFSKTQLEDLRLRFFSAMRTVPADMAARLTQIDYDREMALVATGPAGSGEICGMVHLICDPDNERGEFAALVRSDMKARGLGFGLMTRLIDYARHRGVRQIEHSCRKGNQMRDRLMSEMVRNQRPLTIHPRATVAEACRRMSDGRVGAVLVTEDDGSLVGIFTGRDAVRMLALGTSSDRPVSEVMTTGPCTMESGCTAIEALRLMWDGGFRHIPILDHGRVVGIVSWGDFRGSERDRLDTEIEYWQRI